MKRWDDILIIIETTQSLAARGAATGPRLRETRSGIESFWNDLQLQSLNDRLIGLKDFLHFNAPQPVSWSVGSWLWARGLWEVTRARIVPSDYGMTVDGCIERSSQRHAPAATNFVACEGLEFCIEE